MVIMCVCLKRWTIPLFTKLCGSVFKQSTSLFMKYVQIFVNILVNLSKNISKYILDICLCISRKSFSRSEYKHAAISNIQIAQLHEYLETIAGNILYTDIKDTKFLKF